MTHQPGVYVPLRALFLVFTYSKSRFSHDVAHLLMTGFTILQKQKERDRRKEEQKERKEQLADMKLLEAIKVF